MTLVLGWVPQVASAAVAPAAVVGPPGRDGVDGSTVLTGWTATMVPMASARPLKPALMA